MSTESDGLRTRTLRGLYWSFLERIAQQAMIFVIWVLMARALLPEEFGVVAILMVFIAIARAFIDSGFSLALIQRQNASHLDECSVFYFNVAVGVITTLILYFAAPYIADFYEEPVLVPITRVAAISQIIAAFGIVHTTLLTKRMDFRRQMAVALLATAAGGVVGIAMAYAGYGVWSLIFQTLTRTAAETAFLWVFHRWRPALTFSAGSLKSMFPFGSRLLAGNIVFTVFDNIYVVVIGKLFLASEVGFYSRARAIQQLPSANIAAAADRVTFPAFSAVQTDKPRLKRGVKKTLAALALLNFPAMAGLALVARPLVLLLLTDRWLPLVPYLQLFCAVGALYPLHAINRNVLKAQGRSDLDLRLTVIMNVLKVLLLAVTWQWGIIGILWGQIGLSVAGYFVNTYFTARMIGYGAWEQIRDVSPYLAVTAVMAAAVYAIGTALGGNVLLQMAVQVFAGASIVFLLAWLLRLPAFRELWDIALRFKSGSEVL